MIVIELQGFPHIDIYLKEQLLQRFGQVYQAYLNHMMLFLDEWFGFLAVW